MKLSLGFPLLTAATEAAADLDLDALAENLSQKLWTSVPNGMVTLMRIAVLLVPLIMLVLGLIGLVCPPKEPNWLIGYRTRRSVASEDAWFFAQKLRGILWTAAGAVLLIPSLVVRGLMKEATLEYVFRMAIIYVGIQVAVLLLSLLILRITLAVYFDAKGRRRR